MDGMAESFNQSTKQGKRKKGGWVFLWEKKGGWGAVVGKEERSHRK